MQYGFPAIGNGYRAVIITYGFADAGFTVRTRMQCGLDLDGNSVMASGCFLKGAGKMRDPSISRRGECATKEADDNFFSKERRLKTVSALFIFVQRRRIQARSQEHNNDVQKM